jgi:hypothetical protein
MDRGKRCRGEGNGTEYPEKLVGFADEYLKQLETPT